MKGILGKKIGMTQIYSDHGLLIPVTMIEVQNNIITKILTKEKNGYDGIQLSVFDKKEKNVSKPLMGQFKQANTTPKRFVKEIRDMHGEYQLGDKIDASIFKSGELVDISGISKGKGFAGSIKRHNQHIGPKSHGGGGGSKPIRQTGSLGDISGNKVVKGMTMPGHMGHVKRTIQNLVVVEVNPQLNYILVKGSIPGPNKSFVVIKEAIKKLPNKEPIKLVNLQIEKMKNEFFEEAKKYNATLTDDMNLEQMKEAIEVAKESFEKNKESQELANNENQENKK